MTKNEVREDAKSNPPPLLDPSHPNKFYEVGAGFPWGNSRHKKATLDRPEEREGDLGVGRACGRRLGKQQCGHGQGGRMATYFKDQGKRSENAELEQELASSDKNKKRDAVKKVIRDMTLGKDVSGLFSAVVNNMMTPNLEVRKLVYLYLINYAKTQPDLAIMAVNGFVKDARSHPQAPHIHPRSVSGSIHACRAFQSARQHVNKLVRCSCVFSNERGSCCLAPAAGCRILQHK